MATERQLALCLYGLGVGTLAGYANVPPALTPARDAHAKGQRCSDDDLSLALGLLVGGVVGASLRMSEKKDPAP